MVLLFTNIVSAGFLGTLLGLGTNLNTFSKTETSAEDKGNNDEIRNENFQRSPPKNGDIYLDINITTNPKISEDLNNPSTELKNENEKMSNRTEPKVHIDVNGNKKSTETEKNSIEPQINSSEMQNDKSSKSPANDAKNNEKSGFSGSNKSENSEIGSKKKHKLDLLKDQEKKAMPVELKSER